MEIKYLVVKENGEDDYIFIAGEIENNKLNGWGIEEVTTPEGTKKTSGRFIDGKLDGIGVVKSIKNGYETLLEYGIYQNGKHIDDKEFMDMATTQRVMETLDKFNFNYNKVLKYYLPNEENKIEGPCLLYSDLDYVDTIFKEYRYVSNGLIEGFSFNILFYKTSKPRYYFSVYEKNKLFFEMLDRDWGYKATQKEEIFIKEGAEVIKKNTYKGDKSVVIHIPSSVHTIEEHAINPKKTNYVEVFYDGTKSDWDRINKGYRESWCEDDYTRIGMGVSRTIFVDWAVDNIKITIHCQDGDIITKDGSYRD